MKKIYLTVLSIGLLLGAFAQNNRSSATGAKSKVSIGLEAGIPVGENASFYSSVLGGSLQYEYMPSEDVGITVSGGYLNYALKSSFGGGSVGFVPLMAGFKYYFTPSGVFFHGQFGAAIGTSEGQGTSFAYSPGIGISIIPQLDAEVKYLGISNSGGSIGNVGLRLAYNF